MQYLLTFIHVYYTGTTLNQLKIHKKNILINDIHLCFDRMFSYVLFYKGNITVICKECSSFVSAVIFPLCADTVAAAIESPKPYPPV